MLLSIDCVRSIIVLWEVIGYIFTTVPHMFSRMQLCYKSCAEILCEWPHQSHRATVKDLNPSEKSPSGTDFARQWSWYRPGDSTDAEAARTSGSLSRVG